MSDSPEASPAADPGARRRRWFPRSRWGRGLAYGGLALTLVVVGLVVAAVGAVRAPLPETSGTLTLDGLDDEVTVLRDDAGVPQVYAGTAADLFFAQGFVQAQDRFFDMDVRRHLTAGRLSEMFGAEALEADTMVRTMGWRRVAEAEVAALDATSLAHLEAFSAGVNAYLDDASPGDLSLEYTVLGLDGLDYRVEDWTPVDSVAWLKAMAWDLRTNVTDEIDRALASTALAPDQIAELYPPYPFDRRAPIVSAAELRAGLARTDTGGGPRRAAPRPQVGARVDGALVELLERARAATEAVPATVGTGEGVGSNAWVVDGEHSKTGAPILANDPHLAPSLPGAWYQMGLHCTELSNDCPYDVAGFTFAGFPGVVIGHNRRIAWGFTSLGADVADLYLEAIDGQRYRRGDRWRPLRRRTETIKVAGGDPVTVTVRSSVHGPLVSDVSSTFAGVGAEAPLPPETRVPRRGEGYAVALSWTALSPTRTATAVFALNRAQNWDDFRAAARRLDVPSQNLVYADVDGHIGYQALGKLPVRSALHAGDHPAPGWDPAYDWTGRFVPYDELPSMFDPEEGFVVTANQAVTAPGYGFDLGDGDYGQRSQRIREEIEQRGTLSVQDMADIQLDTYDEFASVLVPYLRALDAGSRYYAGGQLLLREWDFTHDADSAAAAYYNAVWARVLEYTFADDLPETVPISGGNRWFEVVRRILDDPTDPWWDDAGTEGVREARDDILLRALRQGRDDLVRLQSRRPDGWTWGHQHTLTLRNQTLGTSGVAAVEALFNRGDWQVSGTSSVVNAMGWDAEEGFEVTWVPSMRMVVPMDDLDAATWINLTGASGHAFSDHYTDQTDLWARGESRSWPFTPEAVDDATRDRLRLEPRSRP